MPAGAALPGDYGVGRWLAAPETPLFWLAGPWAARQAAARVAASNTAGLPWVAVPLSAASIDRCLAELAGAAAGTEDAVTATRLLEFLGSSDPFLAVLDGAGGSALRDLRIRLMLQAVARRLFPGMLVLVTSPDEPPTWLSPDTATVAHVPPDDDAVTVADARARLGPSLTEPARPGLLTIAEVLASSPLAASGWMLGVLTGQAGPAGPAASGVTLATPPGVATALVPALRSGAVRRTADRSGTEWFELEDTLRDLVLTADRAPDVHARIAGILDGAKARPYLDRVAADDPGLLPDLMERLIGHWLACGDFARAVRCYNEQLLSDDRSLAESGHAHRAIRVCRMLNGGLPPEQASAELAASDVAAGLYNDWGNLAAFVGDAPAAVAARRSGYAAIEPEVWPWEFAAFAGRVCDAFILLGGLPAAADWAQRAQQHAVQGIRRMEGFGVREAAEGMRTGAAAAIEVAALASGPVGVAAELAALAEADERGQRLLRDTLAGTNPPWPEPPGVVDPERLLAGRPAALAAALRGDPAEAERILTARIEERPADWRASWDGRAAHLLLARVQLLNGRQPDLGLLARYRRAAENRDEFAILCELTVLEARASLLSGAAGEALPAVEHHLRLAADLRLGLYWIDLLVVRSELLLALGRQEEARASAAVALDGPSAGGAETAVAEVFKPLRIAARDMPGARSDGCGYLVGAVKAMEALAVAGGKADTQALVTYREAMAAAKPVRMSEEAHLRIAPHVSEADHRLALDVAARQVLRDYADRGTPFALFLRTFSVSSYRGPAEFGQRLLEYSIRDALPPGVELLTVQDREGLSKIRGAPGLVLADSEWQNVVTELIGSADLIVSECIYLTQGVRFELEAAYAAGRWDRTVVLLPSLHGLHGTLDSDPLIQLFPRCVWQDSLDRALPAQLPEFTDLMERLRAIAGLSEDARRQRMDRAGAIPPDTVNLIPLAESYESTADMSWTFAGDDDSALYYGFWRLFRAASIRELALKSGDRSPGNRLSLAQDYLRMSDGMLEAETDDDKWILSGDVAFAEQCARSAYTLAEESERLRNAAEQRFNDVLRLKEAIVREPQRFILRPRYGPFVTGRQN